MKRQHTGTQIVAKLRQACVASDGIGRFVSFRQA